MKETSTKDLLAKIEELENQLAESEQLIDAIKAGEVDAFAIGSNHQSEVYTLQSGDYAYRILIEEFGEGAINVTEEGLIVYTNTSFFEMVKLPYENVVGSLVFDFIHEGSKEKFNDLFAQALTGRSKGEINLLAGNKIIPVYVSLTSLQPKLATIGIIITDFTEKKKTEEVILKYQKDLETKNQELVQSNTELASFAYIASHDLQEPLRKIQIFSSRILDKESANFSPNTKDYFNRITTAAKRMQNLITALIGYSRITTSEIIFETTDLKTVIEDVKSDLSELIEENNVIVEIAELPALDIIPQQIHQLFSNLIINAIKFKKPGIQPLISIRSDIVPASDIQSKEPVHHEKYWKIQVADNGIGFEQKYAVRIFELFQRLREEVEYKGTGIGLAICKKIVQNHGGFIEAVSIPEVGSTFNIYLPLNHLTQ